MWFRYQHFRDAPSSAYICNQEHHPAFSLPSLTEACSWKPLLPDNTSKSKLVSREHRESGGRLTQTAAELESVPVADERKDFSSTRRTAFARRLHASGSNSSCLACKKGIGYRKAVQWVWHCHKTLPKLKKARCWGRNIYRRPHHLCRGSRIHELVLKRK